MPATKDLAFPSWPPGYEPANGLTKRELLAAMAMQGLVSGQRWVNNAAACADDAVRFADALLAELAKS